MCLINSQLTFQMLPDLGNTEGFLEFDMHDLIFYTVSYSKLLIQYRVRVEIGQWVGQALVMGHFKCVRPKAMVCSEVRVCQVDLRSVREVGLSIISVY